MQKQMITLVNLLLILISGACVYYLATRQYQEPKDIAGVREMLMAETETNGGAVVAETPKPGQFIGLDKAFMDPLYTPTPTPTPKPTPTPPPPNLDKAVYSWQIRSLDAGQAEFEETRTKEMFTMKVGGEPHEAKDDKEQVVQVRLQSVDLSALTATLEFEGQTVTKEF